MTQTDLQDQVSYLNIGLPHLAVGKHHRGIRRPCGYCDDVTGVLETLGVLRSPGGRGFAVSRALAFFAHASSNVAACS